MSFRRFRSACWLVAATLCLVQPQGGARAENIALLPSALGVTELFASDPRTGLAMGGFDAVSYRLDAAPRPGRAEHDVTWRGLVWRFASEANRAAFLRDPDTFAPRLGGYDAERVLSSVLVAADPEIYVVRPSGLYLFRSAEHRAHFLADEALAADAEAAWRSLRPGLVQG
jgi:hypothetical protein